MGQAGHEGSDPVMLIHHISLVGGDDVYDEAHYSVYQGTRGAKRLLAEEEEEQMAVWARRREAWAAKRRARARREANGDVSSTDAAVMR